MGNRNSRFWHNPVWVLHVTCDWSHPVLGYPLYSIALFVYCANISVWLFQCAVLCLFITLLYIVLFYSVYYFTVYCNVLLYIVLFYSVHYFTVYCNVLYLFYCVQYFTVYCSVCTIVFYSVQCIPDGVLYCILRTVLYTFNVLICVILYFFHDFGLLSFSIKMDNCILLVCHVFFIRLLAVVNCSFRCLFAFWLLLIAVSHDVWQIAPLYLRFVAVNRSIS